MRTTRNRSTRALHTRALHTRAGAALGAAVLALALGACGADSNDDSNADSGKDAGAGDSSSSAAVQSAALSMQDPWVKAAPSGMTAAFGTLVNDGDQDVTLVGATTEASGVVELHETVQNDDGTMAMQEREGGFTVPAGSTHELAPGGDHLMMMELARALKPGETVTLRLELEDGSTTEIDATVKRFTGAEEEYQSGHGEGHEGEDHEMEDSHS